MNRRPSLTVVNAFVEPVVALMRACLGVDARPVAMEIAGEYDPAPAISVTIETTGELRGDITWTFSPELARDIAAGLLSIEASEVTEATIADAAAELANIAVGNATSALLDAGYRIDIHPPVVHPPDGSRRLPRRTLAVSVHTERGPMRVLIDIEETPRDG